MNFEPEVFFKSPPRDPHSINLFIDGNHTRHIFISLTNILKCGVNVRYSRGDVINFDYIPESELFTLRRYFNSLGIQLLWRWLDTNDSLEIIKDSNVLSEYKMGVEINDRKLEVYFDYLKRPTTVYKNIHITYN